MLIFRGVPIIYRIPVIKGRGWPYPRYQERPCRVLYLRLLHDLQLLRCLGRIFNHLDHLGKRGGRMSHQMIGCWCILSGQFFATKKQHLGLLKMEQVDANRKGNGTPAISGKSRLVRYCDLARYTIWYLVMWWVMTQKWFYPLRMIDWWLWNTIKIWF